MCPKFDESKRDHNAAKTEQTAVLQSPKMSSPVQKRLAERRKWVASVKNAPLRKNNDSTMVKVCEAIVVIGMCHLSPSLCMWFPNGKVFSLKVDLNQVTKSSTVSF